MNRLVCRVMEIVAGLAVLGMTATLAGAQTVEVKGKPRLNYDPFPEVIPQLCVVEATNAARAESWTQ